MGRVSGPGKAHPGSPSVLRDISKAGPVPAKKCAIGGGPRDGQDAAGEIAAPPGGRPGLSANEDNEMNEHDYSLPSQEDTDAYPVDAAGTYTGVML